MTRRPAARGCVATAFIALALLLAACRSDGRDASGRVVITVYAASSLTEAFTDLERGFEQANPNVDVQIAFAGSQVLRLQLEQGAEADVFASANEFHVQDLEDAGLIGQSVVFARNELVIVVPSSNPAGIERFEDLARAGRVVVGTDHVPIGMYTREVLERARARYGDDLVSTIERHIVSQESNVRLVRAKVELGEADAAVVYRTDAASSSRLRVVPIPDALNTHARYRLGLVEASSQPHEARSFIDYVLSPEGGRILAHHGFVPEAG